MKRILALGLSLCLLSVPCLADSQTPRSGFSESDLPDILKPWSKWVMADYKPNHCPFLYNNTAQKTCIWPGELLLKLDNSGAEFQLRAALYDEGWLPLPGSEDRWPQRVKLGGQSLVVSMHEGRPSVFLTPGNYTITGAFEWNEMPESLALPQSSGLLRLEVGAQPVRFPSLDESGTLWFKRKETETTEAERMDVKIFRHITDTIPTRMETRAILHVSGKPREVLLGNTLPENFTPLSIDSQIPARIEPDGSLRLQVRPGTWEVNLQLRGTGAATEFSLPKQPDSPAGKQMPHEEIWVFEPQANLRLVQVEGANPIDPAQTELPQEWRNFPAYYMQAQTAMKITEKKRGNTDPTPDELSLAREMWLDFDGNGYTLRDQLSGNVSQSWRLEVQQGTELGRAAINGRDQFITRLTKDAPAGIEIRPGFLSLDADSRMENSSGTLPATGWAHDMKSVSASLHLPPGWSLFYASGADTISDSWVQRWTLLDVFMLVIVLVATQRLFGLRTALITAPGFILLHHALPPVTSFTLVILGAVALARVLPEGKFLTIVVTMRRVCLMLLVLFALPFMVQHMRLALFPQLGVYAGYDTSMRADKKMLRASAPMRAMKEKAEGGIAAMDANIGAMQENAAAPAPAAPPMPMEDMAVSSLSSEPYMAASPPPPPPPVAESSPAQEIYQYDPSMQSNTGFGVADWRGQLISLGWSGPVLASQSLNLWLISPHVNLLLSIIRVIMLAYILLVLLGVHVSKDTLKTIPQQAIKAFALVVALWLAAPPAAHAEDNVPPAPVLEEMKRKLIAEQEKPPVCAPQCATIARAKMEATGDQLDIIMEIHADETTMVPLPGPMNSWRPTDITLDGGGLPPSLRADADGYIYAAIDHGVHSLHITGPLPTTQDSVNISFPLKPARMEASATGWDIQGLQPDGSYNGSLQLSYTGARTKTQEATLEKNHFPALVSIERSISFGLSWQVETTVRRLSPLGESVAVQVPLLAGETVTSADMPVRDGKAYVSLSPQSDSRSWTSQLPVAEGITLTAPQNTDWPESVYGNEIWRLNISNLWHVTFECIPSVSLADTAQTFTNAGAAVQMPTFAPLAGESLTLHVTRPEGVAGQTLTIDHSTINVKAGANALEATLELTLRASQGGQHTINLPESATISSAMLNGAPTSLNAKDGAVTLPLSPGSQTYTIVWNQPTPMSLSYEVPAVDLHAPSVNAESSIKLPHDRWLLWTHGPQMGPAVLFWGWIPVILLAALALGQVTFTPLRFHHWLLLLLGLTQTDLFTNLVVVGWFLAMGLRSQKPEIDHPTAFNLRQLLLGFWTILSLTCLFGGIRRGLLGSPYMRVEGNQSSSHMLKWYQDIATELLPQPGILSLPVFCYRALMLLWALWLAFALLKWLQWGWKCFSAGGYWQRATPWRKPKA